MSKENPRQINRREFLRIAGLFGVGALAVVLLPELWIPSSAEADRGRGGVRVPRGRGEQPLIRGREGSLEEQPNLGFEIEDRNGKPLNWDAVNEHLTGYVRTDGSNSQRSVKIWDWQHAGGFTEFGAWQHRPLTPLDPTSTIQSECDAKYHLFAPVSQFGVKVRIEYFGSNGERSPLGSTEFLNQMEGPAGQWRRYILGTIRPDERPAGTVYLRRVVTMFSLPIDPSFNGQTAELLYDNIAIG